MYDDSYANTGGALLGIGAGAIIIWLVVVVAFYVWYGWALSRLFTRLGVTGWWGWIPIWNQWQLINRGGNPGWLVLLSGIPIVNFIVVVFTVMSIHRINQESGKGAGFTVLGFFIPPLWATLLGNHLGERMPSAGPAGGYAQPAGYGTAQAAGYGTAQAGAYGAAQNGGYGAAVAQSGQQAYGQQSGYAPQQGYGEQDHGGQGHGGQSYAEQGYRTPGQQSLFAPAPAAEQPRNPWDQPAQQQSYVEPYQQQTQQHHHQPEPQFVEPTPTDRWGLNSDTEREFERLAAEDVQRPPAAPLAPQPPQQHFSWPGTEQQAEVGRYAEQPEAGRYGVEDEGAAAPLPPVVMPDPPAEAPAAEPAPVQAEPVPAEARSTPAEPDPAPAQPDAASEAARPESSPETAPEPDPEPSIFDAATPPLHPSAAAAAAGQAGGAGSAADAGTDAEDRDSSDDDELDRTVVVSRPKRVRWELRLQDGQRIELPGEDVIIGRRPSAREGAVALEIPDPSRTLSKSHARLRLVGEVWTIEDLGSTNGVALVNPDGTDLELKAGVEHAATDQLIIGTLPVSLHRVEETG